MEGRRRFRRRVREPLAATRAPGQRRRAARPRRLGARTDAGALLTSQHRRAQLSPTSRRDARLPRALAALGRRRRNLRATRLGHRAARPVAYNRLSSSVAAAYYQSFRIAEAVGGVPTPRVAAIDTDVVAGTLYVTGRDMMLRAVRAGQSPEAARRTALTRTSSRCHPAVARRWPRNACRVYPRGQPGAGMVPRHARRLRLLRDARLARPGVQRGHGPLRGARPLHVRRRAGLQRLRMARARPPVPPPMTRSRRASLIRSTSSVAPWHRASSNPPPDTGETHVRHGHPARRRRARTGRSTAAVVAHDQRGIRASSRRARATTTMATAAKTRPTRAGMPALAATTSRN